MQMDTFALIPSIPRDVFENKDWLYRAIMDEWLFRLRQAGGMRMPGPLHIKVMHFGYIDDDTMQEVKTLKINRNWTYAVVRVSGPAMSP